MICCYVFVRFGLYDHRRAGETIVPSHDGRLVATTDSFGRIIVIDTHTGVAVRMWKGREKTCLNLLTEIIIHSFVHSFLVRTTRSA